MNNNFEKGMEKIENWGEKYIYDIFLAPIVNLYTTFVIPHPLLHFCILTILAVNASCMFTMTAFGVWFDNDAAMNIKKLGWLNLYIISLYILIFMMYSIVAWIGAQ